MRATQEDKKRPLLVIVGPTGVGKTSLSMRLAVQFDGEIVSADSRLLYQGMDIGTDKPTPADRARIPHHLIDVCRPDETITLGQYKKLAESVIASIHNRNRLPLLVGGTGQYVRAIVEGWRIPRVAPQQLLRQELARLGGPELYRWLKYLDPASGAKIGPQNTRRVIRALEVTLISGRPMSQLQQKTPPAYEIVKIGLTCDRETLYRRIDSRVDRMMAEGLLEEVKGLRAMGYHRDLPSMSGLGYRQIMAHLEGELGLAESVERIKYETHRFARQQHNWFRPDDTTIIWYDTGDQDWQSTVTQQVELYLARVRAK